MSEVLKRIARPEHSIKENRPSTYPRKQFWLDPEEHEKDLPETPPGKDLLELSPEAKLLSSFSSVHFDNERVDDIFYFTLLAARQHSQISLRGELNTSTFSWNLSWNIQAEDDAEEQRDALIEPFLDFLAAVKPPAGQERGRTEKIFLGNEWSKELIERFGGELKEIITEFLTLVVILGDLPVPGNDKGLRYLKFQNIEPGRQTPAQKRAYYFKWSLLESITIEYRRLQAPLDV